MATATTGLVALLGAPVAHSLSPAIHTAGFRVHRLDLAYLAFHIKPGQLVDAVAGLWALGALGANVTGPHKGTVARLVVDQSPEVQATGAANTLVRTADGWRAENTDVRGFLAPLGPASMIGKMAVVLGAGGAARAAVYALLSRGARVTVAARRAESANVLARALAPTGGVAVCDWNDAAGAMHAADLIVHATPVGTGDDRATPWPDASVFHAAQTVYDLVYRPAETRLLREARAAGAHTIGGLPMLVTQAAASFRLWTGRDLPLAAAREAAERALAR